MYKLQIQEWFNRKLRDNTKQLTAFWNSMEEGNAEAIEQIKDRINCSAMQPIYEQIAGQIKKKIMHGELKEDTALPSVRTFAKELKVSALTVKKAYDALEEEGFIITVHGKGGFVACAYQETMLEENCAGDHRCSRDCFWYGSCKIRNRNKGSRISEKSI